MVLVRRRTLFIQALVRALKERQLPVAGVDRMLLTEQLAVMDLMALGRFVLLPEDDLTLATVLKGPLVGLDEDALFALAHGRGRIAVAGAAGPGADGRPSAPSAYRYLCRGCWRSPTRSRRSSSSCACLGPTPDRRAAPTAAGASC